MSRARTTDDPEIVGHRPLYARMLRLKFLEPSGFLCFVFLEGAVALGILLALAELVSWWGVLALPATVAIMVKLNDVIASSLTPPPADLAMAGPSSGLGAAARAGFSSSGSGSGRFASADDRGPLHTHGDEDVLIDYGSPSRPMGAAADHGSPLRPAGGLARDTVGNGFAANDGRSSTWLADDATVRLPAVIDRGRGAPANSPWAEHAEAQEQWVRQSATRRYE